jgi:hypothetical protein
MTKADRLCVKVALWPGAIYAVALLTFMIGRSLEGISPLPAGSAQFVPGTSLLVTFSAIVAANLLRIRLGRLSR